MGDSADRLAEQRSKEFVAMVSHDLKNPLTAIRGHAQLLQRQVRRGGELDRDRLLAGLGKIEETTGRMVALIHEMVDMAHIQASQPLELHPAPTDLVELVRRIVAEYEQRNSEYELRFNPPEESLVGEWDPVRLERVLASLLSNSIKYSPTGGTITVELDRQDDHALLRVRDRGIGIPAADLPLVFERYYRASNVPPGVSGTGLGLTVARQIVEQHGGSISVASEGGSGTTFTVLLPLRFEANQETA